MAFFVLTKDGIYGVLRSGPDSLRQAKDSILKK
jgi:hypothetical protein